MPPSLWTPAHPKLSVKMTMGQRRLPLAHCRFTFLVLLFLSCFSCFAFLVLLFLSCSSCLAFLVLLFFLLPLAAYCTVRVRFRVWVGRPFVPAIVTGTV
jgi:hypothetical protein